MTHPFPRALKRACDRNETLCEELAYLEGSGAFVGFSDTGRRNKSATDWRWHDALAWPFWQPKLKDYRNTAHESPRQRERKTKTKTQPRQMPVRDTPEEVWKRTLREESEARSSVGCVRVPSKRGSNTLKVPKNPRRI